MTTFSIGTLSERTGCNIETIRYYERIGILPSPPRSASGHRLYETEHLDRLTFVRRCRDLGFSLDDVRGLLGLVDGGDYSCAEVKSLTLNHIEAVQRKIGDLKRMERVLSDIAMRCDGGTRPDCPIIEALSDRTSGSTP